MLATLVLQLALAATPVQADTPADPKVEVALQLIEAAHMDRMVGAIKPQLSKMMQQQISQIAPCDASGPVSEAIGREFGEMYGEMMDIDRMKVDTAAIYVEVFTLGELNDLLAFYRSPTGSKMLEKMPEIMQRSMQVTQSAMSEMQPKIAGIMERHGEDLRAASRACAADADEKDSEAGDD